MRPLALIATFSLLAAALAGCSTSPASTSTSSGTNGSADTPAQTRPGDGNGDLRLTLISADSSGFDVSVRLTNLLSSSIHVSDRGFRLVDAQGTVSQENAQSNHFWADQAFPALQELGAGESVQGNVTFDVAEQHPPYTLKYDYAGHTASVGVPEK